MNRSKKFTKRVYTPDHVYGSIVIHRFICRIMREGKKNIVAKAVYQAVENLARDTNKTPKDIFEECLEKVLPPFSVRSKRIASSNYRIPVAIKRDRSIAIALGWLKTAVRESKGSTLADKIYNELHAIYKDDKNSGVLKTKDSLSRIAEKNKAFLHYL